MKTLRYVFVVPVLVACFSSGCSTLPAPPPINFLAIEKPKGVIAPVTHNPVQKDFSRGGWYAGNHNFRPAPDVASYLEDISKMANTGILRNADVHLGVPFAFDILFFGYNSGSDTVTARGN